MGQVVSSRGCKRALAVTPAGCAGGCCFQGTLWRMVEYDLRIFLKGSIKNRLLRSSERGDELILIGGQTVITVGEQD